MIHVALVSWIKISRIITAESQSRYVLKDILRLPVFAVLIQL
jgi:hypothetical protein